MVELTVAEVESLRCCPSSDNFQPAPGYRTAYIKARLKVLGLVQPLWVEEGDEIFFTWQRTLKGDEALEANGSSD